MNSKLVKSNIMIKLAAILLCLVLFTMHLMSGLYAKYSSRSASNGFARVANWDVSVLGGKPALTIDCSSSDLDDEYKITVTNRSEVSVKYDVIVVFEKALESGITLKLDGAKSPVTVDRKEFVFTDAGQMADGDVSVEHVLLFTANTASIEEDSSHTFYVKVDFEQKD